MKTDLGRNLGWATDADLLEKGLHRNDIGQIVNGAGKYVCGITGDIHDKYLRPWIDYDHTTGKKRVVWICDCAIKEMYADLRDDFKATLGETLFNRAEEAIADGIRFLVKLLLSKAGL